MEFGVIFLELNKQSQLPIDSHAGQSKIIFFIFFFVIPTNPMQDLWDTSRTFAAFYNLFSFPIFFRCFMAITYPFIRTDGMIAKRFTSMHHSIRLNGDRRYIPYLRAMLMCASLESSQLYPKREHIPLLQWKLFSHQWLKISTSNNSRKAYQTIRDSIKPQIIHTTTHPQSGKQRLQTSKAKPAPKRKIIYQPIHQSITPNKEKRTGIPCTRMEQDNLKNERDKNNRNRKRKKAKNKKRNKRRNKSKNKNKNKSKNKNKKSKNEIRQNQMKYIQNLSAGKLGYTTTHTESGTIKDITHK